MCKGSPGVQAMQEADGAAPHEASALGGLVRQVVWTLWGKGPTGTNSALQVDVAALRARHKGQQQLGWKGFQYRVHR